MILVCTYEVRYLKKYPDFLLLVAADDNCMAEFCMGDATEKFTIVFFVKRNIVSLALIIYQR